MQFSSLSSSKIIKDLWREETKRCGKLKMYERKNLAALEACFQRLIDWLIDWLSLKMQNLQKSPRLRFSKNKVYVPNYLEEFWPNDILHSGGLPRTIGQGLDAEDHGVANGS